jgi:pyruvate dehydrogenase E1 component alpha subunit
MIRYGYSGSGYRDYRGRAGDYPRPFLLGLFRDMLRIRRIEEAVEADYHKDEMKTPIHLVIGQEACAVGAASALRREDLAFCGHRTHGVYLAKGGSLKAMFAEFFCKAAGCAGSRGGSMHLLDKSVGMAGSSAIVAGAIPIAAGAALAAQLAGRDEVVAVFFGDAATEEGACSETLNFAALRKLPLVFFCENNFYSVQTSLAARQPEGVEIWRRSAGFGLPAVCVDGNNVLAVHRAVRAAWERARAGEGPTFIEARTYRYRAHGGAGDDSKTGYRDPAECEAWKAHDPVETFYTWLKESGLAADSDRGDLEREIETEIRGAFDFARNAPPPVPADLARHVTIG